VQELVDAALVGRQAGIFQELLDHGFHGLPDLLQIVLQGEVPQSAARRGFIAYRLLLKPFG